MKITTNKNFLLFFVLLIFGISSCEKDLYDDQIVQTNSIYKVERFSKNPKYSSVVINNNLLEALASYKTKHSKISNKIVYDSINDFYFDDTEGIKISKDEYESYNYKIIKEGNVENIVFCKNLNGNFIPYRIKYSLNDEELSNIFPEQLFKYITSIEEIQNESNQSLVAMCGHWELVFYTDKNDLLSVLNWVTDFCEGGGGTGDGSGYGGNNSTGYGDGGNNNNPTEPNGGGGGGGTTPPVQPPPILTSPVLELEDEIQNDTPCIKMNLLKNDTEFKAKLQDLKTQSASTPEKAFVTYPKAISNPADNYNYVPFTGTTALPRVDVKYATTTSGVIHCHNALGLSIFSMDDIALAGQMAINTSINTENLVFAVVTKKGTVYAFQITDKTKFIDFYNNYLSSDSKVKLFSERNLAEYNISPNQSIADNEYGFMRMLNQYKVGLTVFRGENTNFDIWKKLNQKKQQEVTAINCNP